MSRELIWDSAVVQGRQSDSHAVKHGTTLQPPIDPSLVMPQPNVTRYHQPSQKTIFPLEYAFHLLGSVSGKTILDLGCGDGLNSVILARLGAKVVSVDTCAENLELTGRRAASNGVAESIELLQPDGPAIPLADSSVHHVLCTNFPIGFDPLITARQVRRLLMHGGTAVFQIPLALPPLLDAIRICGHHYAHQVNCKPMLTDDEISTISRAVGSGGRSRAFWLTTRFLSRTDLPTFSRLAKVSHRMDSLLLEHVRSLRPLAAMLVCEALKER